MLIKHKMAGILPYTQHDDGTFYFLFGRERMTHNSGYSDRGLWSDFGGSRNKGETLKNCAIREGSEELCGFLSNSFIRENISGQHSIKTYATFFVRLDYKKHHTLPEYLNAHYEFMSRSSKVKPLIKDPNNGLYEKDKFAWFSLKDMREKREQFRPFYRAILDLIVEEFSG
jgi:hypothetical protein